MKKLGFVWMICALVLPGCSKSSPDAAESQAAKADEATVAKGGEATGGEGGEATVGEAGEAACEARARAMIDRARALGKAREVKDEVAPRRLAPVVDKGWQPLTEAGDRLYIPLQGALAFPARTITLPDDLEPPGTRKLDLKAPPPPPPPSGATTMFQRGEIADRLAQALASKLGGKDGLVIVADARVPAADIEKVRAALPDGVTGRLLVEKSPAAVLAEHLELAPFTPDKLRELFQKRLEQGNAGLETLFRPLAESASWAADGSGEGPCAAFKKVLGALEEGWGMATLLDVTGKAMIECQCAGVDMDALEAVLIFGTRPVQAHGFVPLPAKGEAWPELDQGATTADLARALAERGR